MWGLSKKEVSRSLTQSVVSCEGAGKMQPENIHWIYLLKKMFT